MVRQIILLKKDYMEFLKMLRAPMSKTDTMESKTFLTANELDITVTKMRIILTLGDEPQQQIIIWYGGLPHLVKARTEHMDFTSVVCANMEGFEFHSVNSIEEYELKDGYNMVKNGLLKIQAYTKDPDSIEGLFTMTKGLEKDDIESN